jgi:hypothetical protein
MGFAITIGWRVTLQTCLRAAHNDYWVERRERKLNGRTGKAVLEDERPLVQKTGHDRSNRNSITLCNNRMSSAFAPWYVCV